MYAFFKQAPKYFPFWYVLTLWGIHLYSYIGDQNLNWLGTHPFHFKEWYTFLTGSLIHGSWEHIANNTYPLVITGLFLVFLYGRYSNFIFITTTFFTGLFIFLFARSSTYHIGASGVAYCWAFLLAASGFFRKDRISLGLGLLVAMLYGSMIWGVLPIEEGVSWDGHLIGALTGILLAYVYRNVNDVESKELKRKEAEEIDEEAYDPYRFRNAQFKYIRKQFEEE